MIRVRVLKTFNVSGDADLNMRTDAVMEELLALEDENLTDADVSADLEGRIVEVGIIGIGATFDEAAKRADAAIRTAIHAAGGSTPGWNGLTFKPHASSAALVSA